MRSKAYARHAHLHAAHNTKSGCLTASDRPRIDRIPDVVLRSNDPWLCGREWATAQRRVVPQGRHHRASSRGGCAPPPLGLTESA